MLYFQVSLQPASSLSNSTVPTGSSGPESRIPVPNKIHLRGLDNFKPEDLEALAVKYYNAEMYERIEWIDDSSANLVYSSEKTALEALRAYAAADIGDVSQAPILQMIRAKDFPGHPETELFVRIAVVSDKKQPRAHERSKFYLMHPEYDPTTRRNRDYRQRDPIRRRYLDDPKYESGRRKNRYDRRCRDEEVGDFNENFYDDDAASISSRKRTSDGRRSSENSLSGDIPNARTRAAGKELFPNRPTRGGSDGRLRYRSASPVRNSDVSKSTGSGYAIQKDNRRKAQILKASLQSQRPSVTKELFPHRATHRRSDAFDAADETADLFANRMQVPFTDGSNDLPSPKRGNGGFSIRGSAARQQVSLSGGFAIKGAAKANTAKELFPNRNAGKELLSGKFDGRGSQRRKAEDMIY